MRPCLGWGTSLNIVFYSLPILAVKLESLKKSNVFHQWPPTILGLSRLFLKCAVLGIFTLLPVCPQLMMTLGSKSLRSATCQMMTTNDLFLIDYWVLWHLLFLWRHLSLNCQHAYLISSVWLGFADLQSAGWSSLLSLEGITDSEFAFFDMRIVGGARAAMFFWNYINVAYHY